MVALERRRDEPGDHRCVALELKARQITGDSTMKDLQLPFDDLKSEARVSLRMLSGHRAGDNPHNRCGVTCNRKITVYEQQELDSLTTESPLSEIA